MKPLNYIILIVLSLVACDHTELTGEIEQLNENSFSDDTLWFQLNIPEELDGIYWVHWEVEPASMGKIHYYSPSILEDEEDVHKKYGKEDRKAFYVPSKRGKAIIRTSGFYKQTNPQAITSKEIIIY